MGDTHSRTARKWAALLTLVAAAAGRKCNKGRVSEEVFVLIYLEARRDIPYVGVAFAHLHAHKKLLELKFYVEFLIFSSEKAIA